MPRAWVTRAVPWLSWAVRSWALSGWPGRLPGRCPAGNAWMTAAVRLWRRSRRSFPPDLRVLPRPSRPGDTQNVW